MTSTSNRERELRLLQLQCLAGAIGCAFVLAGCAGPSYVDRREEAPGALALMTEPVVFEVGEEICPHATGLHRRAALHYRF